jgi:hypothetical protein
MTGGRGEYELGKDPAIGAVLCFWRHGEDVHGDWIRVADLPEDMPSAEIMGHACKTLVEYEAQKRHVLLDGLPMVPSKDLDDGAVEMLQEALSAHDNKLRGHIDWISTHAVFVLAPPSVDPVRLLRAYTQIACALPDGDND